MIVKNDDNWQDCETISSRTADGIVNNNALLVKVNDELEKVRGEYWEHQFRLNKLIATRPTIKNRRERGYDPSTASRPIQLAVYLGALSEGMCCSRMLRTELWLLWEGVGLVPCTGWVWGRTEGVYGSLWTLYGWVCLLYWVQEVLSSSSTASSYSILE